MGRLCRFSCSRVKRESRDSLKTEQEEKWSWSERTLNGNIPKSTNLFIWGGGEGGEGSITRFFFDFLLLIIHYTTLSALGRVWRGDRRGWRDAEGCSGGIPDPQRMVESRTPASETQPASPGCCGGADPVLEMAMGSQVPPWPRGHVCIVQEPSQEWKTRLPCS